jgi:putative hydrolase of the HAD superfamily
MCPDREAFRKAFYHADDTLTETRALKGLGFRKTVEEQAGRVWEALAWNEPESKLRAVVEDFIERTRRNMERNRSLLNDLSATFRLGIVSNFYGNLEPVCEELGIRHLFGCLIDSNVVGVVKPDPKIFQAALDRLEVRAGETVFVGDNVFRDMEGARDMGMPHILVAGASPEARGPCCPGDPVIRSLEELGPLLLNGHK